MAGIGWGLSQAVNFVAYLVLARLVSPPDFGRFAAGSVIVAVGGLFAESGMTAALIHRRDRLEEAASTAFFTLLLSGATLTLLALAISPLVGAFFGANKVGVIAAILSGLLFLSAVTVVPDAMLQRRFSFARRVAVDPIGRLAFAATAVAACARGAGVWGLVAGTYASAGVEAVAAWWFARFRPRARLASVGTWRELASYARHVLASETLRRSASQLDTVLLGRFSGAAALGQYRNGLRLASQPAVAFVSVGSYVLFPALARISDSPDRFCAATRRAFRLMSAVALPVSLAALPLGEPLGVLLLGPRWRPAGQAIAALCGLVVGATTVSVASEVFKAVGKPNILTRVHLFRACAIALMVGALLPFGVVGVAAAMSVSYCAAAVFAMWRMSLVIELPLRDISRDFAAPAIASAAMVLMLFALDAALDPLSRARGFAVLLVAAQIVAGAVFYAALLLAIDPERRRECRGVLARVRARRSPPMGSPPEGSGEPERP